MTSVVVWGTLMLLVIGSIWAIAKLAEATGEARALRRKAEENAAGTTTAGGVVAEPRTTDDTIGKLSGGTF